MKGPIKDQGIILGQYRYGEADKLLKVLTYQNGLTVLLAKGARRLTSRKSSHLDTLNLIKFETNHGHEPLFLSQVESVNHFPKIKSSLKKTRTAYYLAEILLATLVEEQEERLLFEKFVKLLLELNGDDEEYRNSVITFQHFLIENLGFPPVTDQSPETLITYFENLAERPLASLRLKIR